MNGNLINMLYDNILGNCVITLHKKENHESYISLNVTLKAWRMVYRNT